MVMKKIALIAHAPSENTQRMAQAVVRGCQHPELEEVQCQWVPPLQANAEQVKNCHGIILGTTENLGYMSGALKDFFDRIYYPCLESCQGKPVALYIRAGHDGTGTERAINSICSGLKWRFVLPTTLCQGQWQDNFIEQCETLGTTFAAGLDSGIF